MVPYEHNLLYVSAVERGIRNPTVMIVGKLAAALGVRPVLRLDGYAGSTDEVILGANSEK
jgi:transcriptional regulator with XRE-family HTH domain